MICEQRLVASPSADRIHGSARARASGASAGGAHAERVDVREHVTYEALKRSAIIVNSTAPMIHRYQIDTGLESQRQTEPSRAVLDEFERVRGGQFRALGSARLTLADVAPRSVIRLPQASTGGTAEPNDQAYGDTFFESAGVNPFIDTDDDALSTFGLDVDTASYTVVRSYLENGHLPPKEAVRVEEFLNFFDYGDRPPKRGDFALSAEGGPSPFGEGPLYRLLRFSIVGREIPPAERKPAVLTFLVDVSGSMERQNRLGAVRYALTRLLDQLTPADRVGLVAYGNTAIVLVEPTSDHQVIVRAIQQLRPGGSTNLEHGLARAYELAVRYQHSDAINGIILCSDGVANVGRTGAQSLLASVSEGLRKGIEISAIGFGMGNYNDVILERLADQGNGNYYYVDSRESICRESDRDPADDRCRREGPGRVQSRNRQSLSTAGLREPQHCRSRLS